MPRDIHNTKSSLARMEEKVRQDGTISAPNRKEILEFIDYEKARGQKATSILKDVYAILYIARELKGVAFDKATKKDFVKVMGKVNEEDYSEKTKKNIKVISKKFMRWKYGIEQKNQYPECVSWITTTVKKSRQILPEDLITPAEFDRMVKAADNNRDRALLYLLFETGARIGEALNIQLKQLVFNEDRTAWVMFTGKTGMRRVPIIASVEPLKVLFKEHPISEDREAYLFVTRENRISGTKKVGSRTVRGSKKAIMKAVYVPLSYAGARKAIHRIAREAGVKKRIYPHLFRHTSGTDKSRYMPERLSMKYHGWSDANIVRTYSHLSAEDLMDSVKKHYGLEEEEKQRAQAEELVIALLEAMAVKDPSIKTEFKKIVKKKGYGDLFK